MADLGNMLEGALGRRVAPVVGLVGIAKVGPRVVGSRLVACMALALVERAVEVVAGTVGLCVAHWVLRNADVAALDVLVVVGSAFGLAAVVHVGIEVHPRDELPAVEHWLIPFLISVWQNVCPVPREVRVSRGGLRLKKTSVQFGC